MASAVTLTLDTTGDLLNVPGLVLEGLVIEPRSLQQITRKFWGVSGESRIVGGHAGRQIQVPVLIYDTGAPPRFATARALANYIDYDLNTTAMGKKGKLMITSESNHGPYDDCSFEGAALSEDDGIKNDVAGTLGGNYFAICLLVFRQLASGAAQAP